MVVLGGLALLLGGCRTIEGTWGVPPFYEEYDTPSRIVGQPGTETLLRPLVSVERAADRFHVRSLPPFIQYSQREDRYQTRFLPFFFHRRVFQPSGTDVDWMVFPFLFWGQEAAEDSYFGFFPIGGTIKGLFGVDKVTFVLFPLYWKSLDNDKHSLHLLWPLFNTVWGGYRSGWRFLPFYGRYRSTTQEGELRYDRYFVLWPFWIRRSDFLHISPVETFFSFPLYGSRKGERFESHTYLWPLFQTYYDKQRDRSSYMGFLFPFRFGESDLGASQNDIWPFFGVKKQEQDSGPLGGSRRRYRQYALWPIERYDWTQSGSMEITRFWILPLYWHFHYLQTDTLRSRSITRFWPLVSYERSGDEVAVNVISVLWLVNKSYERYYSRWFRIFRYRYKPELWGWEVLWGSMMYRGDRDRREKLFSIFGGLFEVGTREGSFALRLLYIPLS